MDKETEMKVCPFCGQMMFLQDEADMRPEMHCGCDKAVKFQKAVAETVRLSLTMETVCGENCGEAQPGMEPVSEVQMAFLKTAVQAVGMGYVGTVGLDLLDGTKLTLTDTKVKRVKKLELEMKK